MYKKIIGVVEDGTPRAPQVPANPRTSLRFPIGQSMTVEVDIVTSGGAPVSLVGGTAVMTINKKPGPGYPMLSLTGTLAATRGVATFAIAPTHTKNLSPGYYVYDVWFTSNTAASTLNGAITSSQTTLVVQNSSAFPYSGLLQIDTGASSEVVSYASNDTTTNTLGGLTRGVPNMAHLAGVPVTLANPQIRDAVVPTSPLILDPTVTPAP